MTSHSSHGRTSIAYAIFCLALTAALAVILVPTIASTARAQPVYSYSAFHSDFSINADGSLLVRNKVTYEFQDPAGWVGLTIPSSYGTVIEGRVLGGDETPLPDDAWAYEQDDAGYTIWSNSTTAGPVATYIYEYLVYGAIELEADRAVIRDWLAVPADRESPIDDTSVTLRLPAGVDKEQVQIDVSTYDYTGQVTKKFVGDTTAVIDADWLGNGSSYSFTCSWPSSVMDTAGVGFTAQTVKSWDFERFDVDITMNEDSSFTVRETQIVNFHGSFTFLNRDLSTKLPEFNDGRTYGKARIHDITVYNLDGEPYDDELWSVENIAGGKRVHLDFQAQNEQRGWIIEYRMTGETIFAADYDRLYWNTVSSEREVPINYSDITVHLPAGTDVSLIGATQYIDINDPPASFDSGVDGDVPWWRVEDIPPYSTFTIDVSFPKGLVRKPWQYGRPCGFAVIAFSSTMLVALLVFMLLLWWRKGRDIGRTGSTMVRYEPPDKLTPAMVGMLVNEKPSVQDISATIVDLAQRGYLSIFEEEKRSLIRIKKYGFQRLSKDASDLLPYERETMNGLFSSGNRVSQDDLTNKFYTHVDAILNKGVRKEVMDAGLFSRDPQVVRQRYLFWGIVIAILPLVGMFILTRWFDLGWFNVLLLALVPAGLMVAIVGWAMPRRSREGSQAYEYVSGFKEFMETAEKPELEYMTSENFQRNLPYAMVLGVVDAWARKFQDIYTTPPQWYSGTGAAFSATYLASSLNDMAGSLSGTLTSSPSSSGSGGGGGFGGGSSGGGGGGGGSSAG